MRTKFGDFSFPLIFVPSRLCVRLIGRGIASGVSFEAEHSFENTVTPHHAFFLFPLLPSSTPM